MNISVIEQAIIAKLKDDIQGVQIEAYPDKPAEYKLRHARGAVLVSYLGSKYSDPLVTDVVVQDRTLRFACNVVMRHLRDQYGAYEVLDEVRKALTGYRIDGCSRMYPVEEQFIGEEGGIWQYSIDFEFQTRHTQQVQAKAKMDYKDGNYGDDIY